jgi:hypothetical protein
MSGFAGWRIAAMSAALALCCAGVASGFEGLPPGGLVNGSDPAAGIDSTQSVSIEEPANADVVGGALTAGKVAVPWAIFRQREPAGGHEQIFVRSFAGGAWTTRGNGTVGGSSSAGGTFAGSLNFEQSQDGEAPSIDFAGAGRTVPWATWYEDTTGSGFGADNIFASRFDNSGDTNQGKWLFEGQGRGIGGANSVPVPSLNIHTDRSATNPSLAGGAASAGNAPVPWVTWQESDGASPHDQIFVSKAVKPTVTPTCPSDGVNPGRPVSLTGAVATFCWQQVGVERLASGQSVPNNTTDPTLNVDTHRDGTEPGIAFTGTGDTVPWVVWYEQGTPGSGLDSNEMVFAARAVAPSISTPPTGTVDGSFNWVAVGSAGQGVLDASAGGGACAASHTAEEACSLDKSAGDDAEDPRMAAGTTTAGNPTVPWIVWDEGSAATPNDNSVFVARLVNGHFAIANGGAPVGTGDRADITFSGNIPYVAWHHDNQVLSGHFATADQFVTDGAPVGTAATDQVRAPISSACTANPFNADGSACQGGALGTPFFLFTDGSSPASLFADAYAPGTPVTGAVTGVTLSGATINGSVNPSGGPATVSFQYGPTAAYGSTTAPHALAPGDAATAFSAPLSGFAAGTTIHYRAVASTDFGQFLGADQTLTTLATPVVSLKLSKSTIKKLLASKQLKIRLSVNEASKVTLSASIKIKLRKHKSKTIALGKGSAGFSAKGTRTVAIKLSKAVRKKLAKLRVGGTITVSGQATGSGLKSKKRSASAAFKRR